MQATGDLYGDMFEISNFRKEDIANITGQSLSEALIFASTKGPFRYYVIMFLTFLGPLTQLFDDFLTPPTYLLDDVVLIRVQIKQGYDRSHKYLTK